MSPEDIDAVVGIEAEFLAVHLELVELYVKNGRSCFEAVSDHLIYGEPSEENHVDCVKYIQQAWALFAPNPA